MAFRAKFEGFDIVRALLLLLVPAAPVATEAWNRAGMGPALSETASQNIVAGSVVSLLLFMAVLWLLDWEAKWRDARMTAEYVKRLTFLYAMRAPPYGGDDEAATQALWQTLREWGGPDPTRPRSDEDEAWKRELDALRGLPVAERANYYLLYRVQDQLNFFRTRRRGASLSIWLSFGFRLAAAIFAVLVLAGIWFDVADVGAEWLRIPIAMFTFAVAWGTRRRDAFLSTTYAQAQELLEEQEPRVEDAAKDQRSLDEWVEAVEGVLHSEFTVWAIKRAKARQLKV